jgi:hypothetical protein
MAANALINDSRLCSQNGRVMRPREEAIRAIQMIIIIIKVCKGFFPNARSDCSTPTMYVSHSVWESEEAFIRWAESDAFRKAHRQSSAPKGTYLNHPALETFTAALEE